MSDGCRVSGGVVVGIGVVIVAGIGVVVTEWWYICIETLIKY